MRLLGCLLLVVAVGAVGAVGAGSDAAAAPRSHARPFTPTAFSVEVRGRGRPVILIPGLGCPGAVWDDVTRRLQGFQTHTLTLAGFAGRRPIDEPLLSRARDELVRYIRAHRLAHPIVIGHSMGGYLAYWLAASEPALVGPTIVVDAGPSAGPADPDDAAAAGKQARSAWADATERQFERRVADGYSSMSVKPARMRWIIDQVLRSDRQVMGDAVYEMIINDLRPKLRHIRAPVLLVLADGSQQDDYRAAARAIPDHEFVVLPRTGHFVFLDDPEGFVTAVKRFVGGRTAVAVR